MHSELVRTETDDGLSLDGMLYQADVATMGRIRCDAVICLHGVGGNFYGSPLLGCLTDEIVKAGTAVLRVNTRGRDSMYLASTPRGTIRQGAAFEIVDDCRYDVRAWIDLLVTRGFERIGLLGHSLGAIKSIYSQAHDPHPNCDVVVALSPPKLSYAAFQHDQRSSLFMQSYLDAKQCIDAGKSEQLIESRFPFPMLIAAASFIDKYGPAERYNILNFVEQVSTPLHVVFGELELASGSTAFAGLDQTMRQFAADASTLDVDVVAGADHFYSGCFPAATASVLRSLADADEQL